MIDKGALSRVIFLAMLFSSPTTVSPQESSPGSRWLQDARAANSSTSRCVIPLK